MKKKQFRFAGLALAAGLFAFAAAGCSKQAAAPETSAPAAETTTASAETAEQFPEGPTVTAPTGTYHGIMDGDLEEYLGIRYAAPAERWKRASDVTTTSADEIDATEWGPCCIQPYDEVEVASQGELSEDCLNLNIWTKDSTTKGKPVFIFIHGGGFMNGGAHDPMYVGNGMVNSLPDDEDMVYVSISYRTNLFGSIDLTGLEGYTDEYKDSINLWILDQIQALKWVNENIEAWGGDTSNITVCGQSCGGMAISYMLSMPEANQYFQKAIIESGAPFIANQSRQSKREVADMSFEALGVDNLDDLLAMSGEDIKDNGLDKIFENLGGLSNIYSDGEIIPEDWWDRIREGSAKGIKVMIGCMNGENDWSAIDYESEDGSVLTDPQVIWDDYIAGDSAGRGGSNARYLLNPCDDEGNPSFDLDAYLATQDDPVRAMADLYNDMCYVAGTEYEAEALSQYTDTYLFYWTYAPDPEEVAEYCEANGMEAETSPYGRALHSMACAFALGNITDGYPEITGDPDKIPEGLTERTIKTWYSFAKTGDPNNDLIPEWTKFNTDEYNTMVMGEEWSLENDPRKAEREAFTMRPQYERDYDIIAKCVNGTFIGTTEANGVLTFKGIPYAKAPVGDLRWKAPEAVEADDGTYDAYKFGPSAPQYEWPSEPASMNPEGISEDCLTLNVWTADLTTKNKPVMIFFHGGGYAWGGTADPLYSGKNFVKEYPDVIMVSANYRIGLFGFMDFTGIEGAEDYPDAGCLGILDQLQSIRWVKENIEAFGGDPNNITIFGESAGAGTISAILSMDFEDGLFQKAIIESGGVSITNDQEGYDTVGLKDYFLQLTGAKSMDELVAIPSDELVNMYLTYDDDDMCMNDLVLMPLRDGKHIPLDPYTAVENGKNKNIDVIVGSNANEFNYWLKEMALNFEIDDDHIEEAVDPFLELCLDPKVDATIGFFNDEEKASYEKWTEAVPESIRNDHRALYTEFINDIVFRVPSVKLAEMHANAGGNSWVYYFAKESTNPMMGACHASELAYVFDSPEETIFSGTVDEELAGKISNMWANFARTGDPSIDGFKWEKFDAETRKTLVIGNDCSLKMVNDNLGEQREYMYPLVKWGHIQNNY